MDENFYDEVVTYEPNYYKENGMQVIEIVDNFGLDFCLGNVIKYICRAGKKTGNNTVDDLRKALWYLIREINKYENKD